MVVRCFSEPIAAQGYAASDILLFTEPSADTDEYFGMMKGERGPCACAYVVNVGGSKCAPFILMKFLQYKHKATHVIHPSGEPDALAGLFGTWESLVPHISRGPRSIILALIGRLEEGLNGVAFFPSGPKLCQLLKQYVNSAHLDALPTALEVLPEPCRSAFSFPRRESLNKAVLSLAAARKMADSCDLGLCSSISSVYDFVTSWRKTSSWSEDLQFLSCLAYRRAVHTLEGGEPTGAVVLCHRALDLFLARFFSKVSELEDSNLLDKYSELVRRETLNGDARIRRQLEVINECRNKCFLTHGTFRISRSVAERVVKDTREVILTVDSVPSRWDHYARRLPAGSLSYVDLFALEPDPNGLLRMLS